MYNSEIPNREELPSARRLLRSTLLALVAALRASVAYWDWQKWAK